ncbi:hypothetical protein RRG08_034959 [Elysia crispata]|uniref:RNA-binding motif protein, X-linked 2 n=1 Tax=Elysia crispata TaxID=231223 RepID=A0AAE0Y1Z5_9GAST|nr:hypothetical protein RRG08_034959 [Elysia crispata]
MNPLTNIKNIQKLNDRELELGIIGNKSWHDEYKDSAWIFIGGLPFDLTEGDILCVFSQYGEIVNLNLVRDHKTGKSKGFAFLCFEDQRSTVLSVDNLNGIKILGRTIRVDHVKDYKVPKEYGDEDELTKKVRAEGVAPKLESSTEEDVKDDDIEERKTEKKAKKKKKKKDKKKRREDSSSNEDASSSMNQIVHQNGDHVKLEVKKEKFDPGYNRAVHQMMIKEESLNDQRPRTSYTKDHQSKSSPRSPPLENFHHKNRTTSELRNQRHDSDSDSEPGGSRQAKKPQFRDNRSRYLGGGNHSRLNDDMERGGDRDDIRSRRREDNRGQDLSRSRDTIDRYNYNRRERSRERRRAGSPEKFRERSRERDRDYTRARQDGYSHSRNDYERDRDRYR